MWYAGCNISSPCVLVILFVVVFAAAAAAAAALEFIDIILNGCCSCGVTVQSALPCQANILPGKEKKTRKKTSSRRLRHSDRVVLDRRDFDLHLFFSSVTTRMAEKNKCSNCLYNRQTRNPVTRFELCCVNQAPETLFFLGLKLSVAVATQSPFLALYKLELLIKDIQSIIQIYHVGFSMNLSCLDLLQVSSHRTVFFLGASRTLRLRGPSCFAS